MNVARVIGAIWATRKHPDLEGAKVLVIQPLSCDLDPIGRPIAAVDTVGAGEGELVFYVTAYEAVIPFFRPAVPIDASIVGIVDHVDHDPGALEALRAARPQRATFGRSPRGEGGPRPGSAVPGAASVRRKGGNA